MRHILVLVEDNALADAALGYARQLARGDGAPIYTLEETGTRGSLVSDIAKQRPDFVVLATRDRPSVDGWLMHDVADQIIRAHLAPLLLINCDGDSNALAGQQIVVPLDGSELAEAALPVAIELAHDFNSRLILFQAVPNSGSVPYAVPTELEKDHHIDVELAWSPGPAVQAAQNYLDLVTKRLGDSAVGLRIAQEVRVGELSHQLRDLVASNAIGLIVMVSRGRGGLARWLVGSSLADVVHNVTIPVVAVPPHEPQSIRCAWPEASRIGPTRTEPYTVLP
jgi:nucleotide-binding universal stress UspA family protein